MVINVESFDDIEKASQKLLSLSQTYTEIYTQLMQSASTMGTAWEGADNQAFVEQITGFTEELIIPGLSEPPVRTLGATIPENESHIFR